MFFYHFCSLTYLRQGINYVQPLYEQQSTHDANIEQLTVPWPAAFQAYQKTDPTHLIQMSKPSAIPMIQHPTVPSYLPILLQTCPVHHHTGPLTILTLCGSLIGPGLVLLGLRLAHSIYHYCNQPRTYSSPLPTTALVGHLQDAYKHFPM